MGRALTGSGEFRSSPPAQVQRRNSEQTANMIREMALMRESGFDGDLADGQMPFREQRLGLFHTPLDHILMNRHAHRFSKRGIAVRDADARHPGNLFE